MVGGKSSNIVSNIVIHGILYLLASALVANCCSEIYVRIHSCLLQSLPSLVTHHNATHIIHLTTETIGVIGIAIPLG